MHTLLEQYLFNRGLIDPKQDPKAAILENEELLASVAGLHTQHGEALKALIRARLDPIREELLFKALPQETVVLRQALLEVAAIISDAETYAAEYERRKNPAPQTEEDIPAPTVEAEPALGGESETIGQPGEDSGSV